MHLLEKQHGIPRIHAGEAAPQIMQSSDARMSRLAKGLRTSRCRMTPAVAKAARAVAAETNLGKRSDSVMAPAGAKDHPSGVFGLNIGSRP